MLSRLTWIKLSKINLCDPFFNSLRADYGGSKFDEWFLRKANTNKNGLVLIDQGNIHAFLFLQRQNEVIKLHNMTLSAKNRLKISTLKLDEIIGRQRLGEGIIGVTLWYWQRSKTDEIFVTVFPKQKKLIGLLEHFDFDNIGIQDNGEIVLMRSRNSTNYSSPYTSFPFINPDFTNAGIIPIKDVFHDRLFPYSESVFKLNEVEEIIAGNGITKVYIGNPYTTTHYSVGQVVCIYRIYSGNGSKGNKSAVTSFCTITKVNVMKQHGEIIVSEDTYLSEAGNKTVFSASELKSIYNGNKNVVMIEMVYNGFFNKSNNVTYWQLKNSGLFEEHPYSIIYSRDQFEEILRLGGVKVEDIIISKTGICKKDS